MVYKLVKMFELKLHKRFNFAPSTRIRKGSDGIQKNNLKQTVRNGSKIL